MPEGWLVVVAMLLRYTILLLMLQGAVFPSSRARHFAREKDEERKEGSWDLFALKVQLPLLWYIFPLMHAFKSALLANAPLLRLSFALQPRFKLWTLW